MIPTSLHITGSFTLHQHPTGDPTPSSEDIAITKRLKEAGEIMGIKLLDHIIVGDGEYLSFVERGLL
jgi:DNA repair protein RadC